MNSRSTTSVSPSINNWNSAERKVAIFVVVGILIVAVAGKLQAAVHDYWYFQVVSPATWVLILVETLVAISIAIASLKSFVWKSAGLMFAVFSVYLSWLVVAGHGSCGCIGKVSAIPRYMLVMAVAVAVAVLCFDVARRLPSDVLYPEVHWRFLFASAGASLIVSICIASALLAGRRTGLLGGPSIVAQHAAVEATLFKEATSKKVGKIKARIAGSIGTQLAIVGTDLGCDSTIVSQMPVPISPGEFSELEFKIALPPYRGVSAFDVQFFVQGGRRLSERVQVWVSHD